MPIPKKPVKLCRAGGRVFEVYRKYDALVEHEVDVYPDFEAKPEYTAEGRPFRTAADTGCPHGRPQSPQGAPPGGYEAYGDCGGCIYFHREAPYAIIGVCGCEAMRRAPGSGAKDDENAQDQMEGNPHAQEK
ncbi:MAG: hypothetical protein GXY32_07645 [Ruminococcaceae bacterium]|nr:hypothetical protein [Oscillospiraceae bacterium]